MLTVATIGSGPMVFQPRLLRGGRQELVVDQGLQRATERIAA